LARAAELTSITLIADERKPMKQVDPSTLLRRLARCYQQAESRGFPEVLLAVIFAAGGLATSGVLLLAFLQTRAALVLAVALALAATLTVLLTIVAMLGADETSQPSDRLRTTAGKQSDPTTATGRSSPRDRNAALAHLGHRKSSSHH
jgi:hypothetical protein